MPIVDGEYDQLTAAEIRSALESELQAEFGSDIDLTESSVFLTLATVLGEVLSNNQEQSIEQVYQSVFLDTATGVDLDRVVAIIGIQRRDATHATGVQRFIATGPVTQDYIIQSGTPVQTAGDDPIEFETSESVIIELIDSFEDGDITEYSGDVASGSVISDANAPHGSNVLEMDATAGAHIYNDNVNLKQGTTFHGYMNPTASTEPALTFAVQQDDPDNYYQAVMDESADEVRIERVDNGSVTATIDTLASAGLTAGSYHEVEIEWAITDQISVTVYDPSDNELGTLGGSDPNYFEGHCGFKSGDANGTKRFDWYTTSEVSANIRASAGGSSGNVGPNSITKLPSPPSGVNETTNLYNTGDADLSDTNEATFVVGLDEESDDALRERAEEAVTGGGDATHDAIVYQLINEVPGVTSVSVFQNKTDVDNTGSGGLPPYSFEAVVYGGDDADVADAIFEKKAVTARDYGGANGTETTVSVTAESNAQQREISFSRPAEVNVDMTLDLVINEEYIGDDDLRDDIAEYIGGTLTDGGEAVGLGVSDDVLIDQIRDIVVGENTGVVGFDNSVDGTPISTTPSITTVDGLDVIDIGSNEVAQTNATDGSIILNTREQ